jgi:hypothetical protein
MGWLPRRGLNACVFAVVPLVANALEPDQIFEKLNPSCWGVAATDASQKRGYFGSAVVVGPGRLITNCHVVQKAKHIRITKANLSYEAALEFADTERDLCQIKVENFSAPAVQIASAKQLRVGQKTYAIGNPEGLELTLSEGIISSLRRPRDDGLPIIQTTAPISHGSSGGGLFDSEGRLIGITTFGWKKGQNLNFAHPAEWIYEVEGRHKLALAKPGARKAAPAPSSADRNESGPIEREVGETWAYELTDHLTGLKRPVTLRIDKIDHDKNRIIFNQGARIEDGLGRILEINAPLAGALDVAAPPGGWIVFPIEQNKTWQMRYEKNGPFRVIYELKGAVVGEETVTVPAGAMSTIRIEWEGQASLVPGTIAGFARGVYKAIAWYSQEHRRIVKFKADYYGPMNSYAGLITHETLELTSHSTE